MEKNNFLPKKRYLILLITVVVSIALYFLSYYITRTLVYSSFSRLTVRVFSIMKNFSYVLGIDIIVLAGLTYHLMTTSKLKGNIEYHKGFMYSFLYVMVLAAGYSFMWISGIF